MTSLISPSARDDNVVKASEIAGPMSTRILRKKPDARKRPRQARSKAMVDALVEAAARVLAKEGWRGFTTNKVAELAGVSIGSLYQYYPDKTALLEAVRERHLKDCFEAVERSATCLDRADAFARCIVHELIEVHRKNPGLHRVLIDEAPISAAMADPHSGFEGTYLGLYADCVARLLGQSAGDSHLFIAQLLSDAIDGAIHNAARRGQLEAPELARELARLVSCYLQAVSAEP